MAKKQKNLARKSDDAMFLPLAKAMCLRRDADRKMSLRAKIRGPRGILCTRGEKEYASIRQPTVACDNRLVKREAYDASPGRALYKSDDAMFLPLAKAMCLRRDVCLRHVLDSLRVRPPIYKNNRGCGCFFGVPGGSRTLDTRRRRPVLYPTELRIRL